MMRALSAIALLAALVALPAAAETTRVTASNSVVVGIDGDAFKPRQDFSAPTIIDKAFRFGAVYAIRHPNTGPDVYMVQGLVSYNDAWRNYDRAYMRGGEAVEFLSMSHEVTSCRIRPCTLQEQFQLTFTPEQVAKGLAGGGLVVQVAGAGGGEFIVTIPATYMAAVAEVRASAAPSPPTPAGR